MKAEITFNELYWNHSLMGFYFRTQSENTLNELLDRAKDRKDAVEKINDNAEWDYDDLDELEEDFYSCTVEELAEKFGIELEDGEDEDDE